MNTSVMALAYFGMGTTYERVLDGLNMLFALIFSVEALIRIIALRSWYFEDNWNR